MHSKDDPVIVIGAGVSGLRVASLLSARGVRCVLLDARARAGGRAASIAVPAAGGAVFDLGPTWHWPSRQPRIAKLVDELGLSTFPQFVQGAFLVERFRFERAQRYAVVEPPLAPARRLDGGIQSLLDAMLRTLPDGVLRLGQDALCIHCEPDSVRVDVSDAISGARASIAGRAVVLAVPPRIVAERLSLRPPLPEALRRGFQSIPTWIAGQAKAIAVYESPFWREQGYSGLVSSVVGPLQELHDASPRSGPGALFGFFGLSATARRRMSDEERRALVIEQLVRLFGERAAKPLDVLYKDWALETHIASSRDLEVPNRYVDWRGLEDWPRVWNDRVFFAGTEFAREHPGYLEGALESAEHAALLLEKTLLSVTPVPDRALGGP